MTEIINRFFEETNLNNNENIQLILFYGSRATDTYNKDSDIDLFMVTTENENKRISRIVDGYKIECIVYSLNNLLLAMQTKKYHSNNYFASVLQTGKIIKNQNNIYELVTQLFDETEKMTEPKRTTSTFLNQDISEYYLQTIYYLKKEEELQDYYYYNLIEKIRKKYHIDNGYSYISQNKVYDAYQNKAEYEENYKLKLPNISFINDYFRALTITDVEERVKCIQKLLSYVELDSAEILNSYCEKERKENFKLITEEEINYILISLNSKKNKVIDSLMKHKKMNKSAYHILLKDIYDAYHEINKHLLEVDEDVKSSYLSFKEVFVLAQKETIVENQIELLENLFFYLEKNNSLDYDDYELKFTYKFL